MNRSTFYQSLRARGSGVFGRKISQAQVDVMEAMLDAGERGTVPLRQLAYIFATAYHETGHRSRMVPSRESLYYTSAARIKAVWPSRFTLQSARAYVRNERALANKVYNGRLGNRPGSDDGWRYRGGGLAHETGRDNYHKAALATKVDLVSFPHRILEPEIAVRSIVHGMLTGRYTGKRLSDYITGPKADYFNARAIVNGDKGRKDGKRRIGDWIAIYALAFERALTAADYTASRTPVIRTPEFTAPATGGSYGGFLQWLANFMAGISRTKKERDR